MCSMRLLPIVAVIFGMGALTFLTEFLEWAGLIFMIGAMIFFGLYFATTRGHHHVMLIVRVRMARGNKCG